MIKNLQTGQGVIQGIVVLAVLLVIVFSTSSGDRKLGSINPNGSPFSSSGLLYAPSSDSSRTAAQAQYISIGSGNAAYAYQSYEEYITIDNTGSSAVNLSGWQLRNGKDERPYYSGNILQRFSADVAVLPAFVLEAGGRAVITTGSVGVQTPYKITNFKENICTGYIEALPDYAFTPSLSRNCPRPSDEPGVENLDRECRDFLSYMPSCQTPVFGGKDKFGERCDDCIDGKRLSGVCRAFIKEHYSYRGCLAYHSSDKGFESKNWRIFLGRGWEMWADKYETIELYNTNGQLVDYENY